MDISSAQRLAAYSRDFGIDPTRTTDASKADPSKASARAKAQKNADASGVQVSLSASAQAISKDSADGIEGVKSSGNAPDTAAPSALKEGENTHLGPRSNRSLAVEAYQKNASSISSSRIRVIA